MLPNDFPPHQTVYYWLRRPVRRFLFRTIHDLILMLVPMCEQRKVVPLAGIVDSPFIKAQARVSAATTHTRRSAVANDISRSIPTGDCLR